LLKKARKRNKEVFFILSLSSFKAGVLTISDSCSQGAKSDDSGKLIVDLLKNNSVAECFYKIVSDDISEITSAITLWTDNCSVDFILTTGGTGLFPRDVTPEAVSPLLDREIPGISEAIRIKGLEETPNAMLSRGVSGIRNNCLIITLPGSPKAVGFAMKLILPALSHAIKKIKGDSTPCHLTTN
jgi:molybdenum cofactor synthesis domain-containing protein